MSWTPDGRTVRPLLVVEAPADSMIERVAQAICEADPLAPSPDAPILIGMKSVRAWEARVDMARAAIAAMREPTKAMIKAADTYDHIHGVPGSYESSLHHWQVMIDEALK